MDRDAAERIKNELLRKMKDMSNTIADSYSDFSHGKPVFCDASIVQLVMKNTVMLASTTITRLLSVGSVVVL